MNVAAAQRIAKANRLLSTTLDLSGLDLQRLPPELATLTNLSRLYLSDNRLTTLPDSIGNLTQLTRLYVEGNQLTTLPESIGNLTQLTRLYLNGNRLTSFPDNITKLTNLDLSSNRLTTLPDSIGNLNRLNRLNLEGNQLTTLPESIGNLTQLNQLNLDNNRLTTLPESIGNLTQLTRLYVEGNQLTTLPESIGNLTQLTDIDLNGNHLASEIAAAASRGISAVRDFCRELQTDGMTVRETKLVLVGEGAVGKSSLLAAMLGEAFDEKRITTHGVEVKPLNLSAADDDTIILNAWDFGGQKPYRPTHQFFFTSPAIYIVAWHPRHGADQGCIDEWINLIRHRIGDEARIHIVATHSDPNGQPGDIDRHRLNREHGKCIAGYHWIDSRTGTGIPEVKAAITATAKRLPHLERRLPARWRRLMEELNSSNTSHLNYGSYLEHAARHDIDESSAHSLALVATELGHWCFYPDIPALRSLVVIQGDWLSRAVSFVMDDHDTKSAGGLIPHQRLSALWDNPDRPASERYPDYLHEALRVLMREYQIAYDVRNPDSSEPVSLISQLVPTTEPDLEVWDSYGQHLPQQTYIIRFVDANDRTAIPPGLMNQLITWYHRFSLGRDDHHLSLHWAHGVALDDGYNGRALIRIDGTQVTVTVKAASPNYLCTMIANDICKYLSDWQGLTPTSLVLCGDRCVTPRDRSSGTAAFDLSKLQARRAQGKLEAGCGICYEQIPINALIGDGNRIPTDNPSPENELAVITSRLDGIHRHIIQEGLDTRHHLSKEISSAASKLTGELSESQQSLVGLLSRIYEEHQYFLKLFTDEAVSGPRLFTIEQAESGTWPSKLLKRRFRIRLWCEHSQVPVSLLDQDPKRGVYTVELSREWLVNARPWIAVATRVLRLSADFGPALLNLSFNDEHATLFKDHLDLAEATVKELTSIGDDLLVGAESSTLLLSAQTMTSRGQLKSLHQLLEEKDPNFAGLKRVRDRDRFLWVHPRFAHIYD
ncbi:COR domain-containing protein [Glycomyces sp. NRRL B-16210]|uniref:leucine-rich repeat domain-containing protein n=1 Tax=Glycomyces sp. NRRL B-16210 TaxID=1463821 RepID=UPI000A4421D9|nr:COR domain-containing protein [Glycomyces sp. NRRL B-16210]